MDQKRVVVVGAGMAGLVAAGRLAVDHAVLVVDKGRGVGGRMATRRLSGAAVDHGAQFLTAHSRAFAAALGAWETAGVVVPWFRGEVGPDGPAGDGHVRYRGAPTMTGIARHLATGHDVRTGVAVTAVAAVGAEWAVHLSDGTVEAADAVVLTAPVPQGLALCAAGDVVLPPVVEDVLRAVAYDPCLAVLAVLSGPSGLPPAGAIAPADGPLAWIADASLKGITSRPSVTIHARPGVSRDRWDDDRTAVAADLLDAAGLASGSVAGLVQVHGWRYPRPTTSSAEPCLVVEGPAPLVWAGDAFGGPAVEGAYRSGIAAADALTAMLRAA